MVADSAANSKGVMQSVRQRTDPRYGSTVLIPPSLAGFGQPQPPPPGVSIRSVWPASNGPPDLAGSGSPSR